MIRTSHFLSRTIKTAVVMAGLGLGSFAVATAATSSWSPNTSMGASTLPDADFGTKISSLNDIPRVALEDANVSISIWSDSLEGVCIAAKWFSERTTDTACSPLTDIASGGVFVSHLPRPDSTRLIVGIVPDGVASVEIAGQHIAPSSNVWYFIAASSVDSYSVTSADGSVRASMNLGSLVGA